MKKKNKQTINKLPQRNVVSTGSKAEKEYAEAVAMFNRATKENQFAGYTPKIKMI
jgi:hypothetical protein